MGSPVLSGDVSPADTVHSDESSDYEDDLGHRPLKRRRTSPDREQLATYEQNAPSRIRKGAPIVAEVPRPSKISSIAVTDASFESLGVAPWLVNSLAVMEVRHPTEIQHASIPAILEGRDCIGGSRTGTGKTIAFAVPILQKWAEDPFGIYAVILTPTRELALQIFEQFQAIGAPQSLKTVLITGGTDLRPQAVALAQRPHIVVATPGRLADHIQNSGADTVFGLSRAKVVVLDEADRLLASGHGSMLGDVETCLSALPGPASRLTLLFTATVTPEVRALKSLPRPASRLPVFVSEINDPSSTSPASLLPPKLKQTYLQVPSTHKDAFLHILLAVPSIAAMQSILLFTNHTATADLLHRTLLALDHSVTSLHSSIPQSQRSQNLSSFRGLKCRMLVATGLAARGLDIPQCQLVINYDVPRNPDDYVHRVGRTARAGRAGTSITFVGQRDVELVLAIEGKVGRQMEEWKEEGVNVETRVVRGRVLKDVAEAKMEASRERELGKDIFGRRKKLAKKRT